MDRAEIKEKLMAEGFAEVIPPTNGRRYFRDGKFFDIDGNEISEEQSGESGSNENPEGDETTLTADPTAVSDELDNRIHIAGVPLEEVEDKKELYDYVTNILGMEDVHHNTGKDKLIKIIKEAST